MDKTQSEETLPRPRSRKLERQEALKASNATLKGKKENRNAKTRSKNQQKSNQHWESRTSPKKGEKQEEQQAAEAKCKEARQAIKARKTTV